MKKTHKTIITLICLLGLKVVFSACESLDTSTTSSSSSGSSGGSSVSAKPRVISKGFGTQCGIQVSSHCAASDVRYSQYEDCINQRNSLSACEEFYGNYKIQANLCKKMYDEFGC